MAIKLNTGFNIRSNVPIDARFILTFEQMTLINDKLMPENYFAVSSDDGKLYIYSKSNEFNVKTGRFRLAFESIDAKLDELIEQSTTAIEKVKAETALKTSELSTRITDIENEIAKIPIGNIGQSIELTTDDNYKITAKLLDSKGTVVSLSTIDLPIESLIKSVTYDKLEKDLVFTLESGEKIITPLDDLVKEFVTSYELAEVENKIPLRLSDLTNDTAFITEAKSNTNLNNALKNYRSAAEQDGIDATFQKKLTPGANIKISKDGVISAAVMTAPGSEYFAGEGIEISGDNIISASLTEQIVDAKIESAASEITNHVDNLIAESTTNIDKTVDEKLESYAKLNDVYLNEEIIVPQTIGGIAKDTVYSVDTPVMQIIKDLFAVAPVPTGFKLYYGLSKEIPTSIDNLNELIVDKDALKINGFEIDLSPNDDYQIFALDKELGLKIKSIRVAGFDTEFTFVELGSQYLYYTERADDTFTYEIVFKEA